jgi:DNA-3-methyladenine glycosylase II
MMNPMVNQEDTEHLFKSDGIFADIHEKYGPPPNWIRPEGFVTLSRIILEQLISLPSAYAHFVKLEKYIPEFTPFEILKLSDMEMRNCQISRQKAKSLRALSSSILEGSLRLNMLKDKSPLEVKSTLMAVHGIGSWTSDIYLIFALQSKDIFPLGDVAILNTVKELTGKLTTEDIATCAEKWRPFRSLASFYLWHYYLTKRNRSSIGY